MVGQEKPRMEKLSRQQILSLPNGITVTRILAIPLILVLLKNPDRNYQIMTAVLFFLAAVTDTLDGYFARKRRMVTTLGKFLDPMADKLLIVTTLIGLITTRGIPVWMVIVIVGREIAVTGLRGIAASQGIIIAAGRLGKYKTVFEVASVTFFILNGDYLSIRLYHLGMALLWVAVILAVLSGFDYFRKFLKEIIL